LLSENEEQTGANPTIHIVIFSIFSILAASSADMNIFLDIRDGLLLNNPIGRSINAFYYENSLYAARIFKSPTQRLLKTCIVDFGSKAQLENKVIQRLLMHDYIPVQKK